MQVFKRILDLQGALQHRSVLLLGPRQTGKSFLLRQEFPDAPCYNLLLADHFSRLGQDPTVIRQEFLARRTVAGEVVVIDEIQKLPALLDEVQFLIEEHQGRFILTGSSARKLKRRNVNLLAGRAWTRHLFPLVSAEIPDFDLLRALNYGTLPSVYSSAMPEEDLLAYCGSYLQEEIQAEAIVRRIHNFARFLQVAALSNAEQLNYESVARDAQVPARTVREYFTVLTDTLLGTVLPTYGRTVHRKAVSTSKFYFFDVGVCNQLAGRQAIGPKTELFGKCFEHFVFTELRAWLDYTRDRRPLTFWRDRGQHEVDFVVGDDLAIEVKGTESVHSGHLKGLRMLAEEVTFKHQVVVSLVPEPRRLDSCDVLPWQEFLTRLWGGAYSA